MIENYNELITALSIDEIYLNSIETAPFLSIKEAAQVYKIPISTLYYLGRKFSWKSVKVNNGNYFDRNYFENYKRGLMPPFIFNNKIKINEKKIYRKDLLAA